MIPPVRRIVPDYGVERMAGPLHKEALRTLIVLALVFGLLVAIGVLTFQPVPPPAPAAAPATGVPPVPRQAGADRVRK
jgi:hypothetical protein